ncbi:hypothetical protein TNCV_213951 [Trichonephila clavipes]|nr:hypothetical protein TNCV_213951 [Trichonephila clavipes]
MYRGTPGLRGTRFEDHCSGVYTFLVGENSGIVIRCLTLLYKATRGLLIINLVILNLGQVTRRTPELEPLFPNLSAGRMASSTRRVFSGNRTLAHELVTIPLSYRGHQE